MKKVLIAFLLLGVVVMSTSCMDYLYGSRYNRYGYQQRGYFQYNPDYYGQRIFSPDYYGQRVYNPLLYGQQLNACYPPPQRWNNTWNNVWSGY